MRTVENDIAIMPTCQRDNHVPFCALCGKHSTECPREMPNRLFGVEINREGDAI